MEVVNNKTENPIRIYQEKFREMDPQQMAKRSGCEFRDGAFEILLMNRRVRLTFRAETSQQPVISQMVLDCGCPVNILYADMKELDSEMYGQMLLELPPSERDAEKVISWLKNSPLEWQEEVQPCFPKCS